MKGKVLNKKNQTFKPLFPVGYSETLTDPIPSFSVQFFTIKLLTRFLFRLS